MTGLLKLIRKTKIAEIVFDFLSLFFLTYCYGCLQALVKGEDLICTKCLMTLPKTNYHLYDETPIKRKLSGRLPIKYGWAFLEFKKSGIVQQLLHELKYYSSPDIGIKLGKIYGHDLLQGGHLKSFDIIVSVPLHKSKMRIRGYNQSSKFAEGISKELHIPCEENILRRKKATSSQTKKNKTQRWENVKDAFELRQKELCVDKRILLVDDVITTGATIEACGQLLIDAGCRELSVVFIAEA